MKATIPPQYTSRLRILRAYHWKGFLHHKDACEFYAAKGNAKAASMRNKFATEHLHLVQILDDFFPFGDTAEADVAKGIGAQYWPMVKTGSKS